MLNKLILNKDNPRDINSPEFRFIKQSLLEFPEMLEFRPIVHDENLVVLGGNMRVLALRELVVDGFEMKPEYIVSAEGWSEERKKEFVIKDNTHYGDWNMEMLANEWTDYKLDEWGVKAIPDWSTAQLFENTEKKPKKLKTCPNCHHTW